MMHVSLVLLLICLVSSLHALRNHIHFSRLVNHAPSSLALASGDISSAGTAIVSINDINKHIEGLATEKDKCKLIVDRMKDKLYGKAKDTIKKGDVVYSISMSSCFDIDKATQKFGNDIKASQLKTGDLGMLALLLLSEKAMGSSSKFTTYIQSLPVVPPGILSWDPALLEELKKSTTRQVEAQLNAVEYDSITVGKLAASLPKLFSPTIFNTKEFRWAMGVVKSRVLYIDGKPMLVPGMDYIEFDPLSTAEPYSTSSGMWGGKDVRIAAERSYESGEELVMSYGLKSSAECLEDHGIVPDINLDESCCEIAVDIDGSERFADDKVGILERAGYRLPRAQFDLEADYSDVDIDPALLQFLRLKLIEGKDAFILESCFMDTVFQTMSQPFSKFNEVLIHKYLKTTCESLLNKINTMSSNGDDEAIVSRSRENISNAGEYSPQRVALARLRLQERASLLATVENLTVRLEEVEGQGDTREYYQERRLRELNLLRPLDESEIILPGDRASIDDYDLR